MTTALVTKSAPARMVARAGDDDPGSFDAILSNGTKDRDGESLPPELWKQPLPESISLNVNHSKDVADVVASGTPWIDGKGNLRVRGTFASTPEAQRIRTLVKEGHLRTVSVEFTRTRGPGGQLVHELVAGAFVKIPSNPEAVVLESKSYDDIPPLTPEQKAEGIAALELVFGKGWAGDVLGKAAVEPEPEPVEPMTDEQQAQIAVKLAEIEVTCKALVGH